MKRKSLTAIGLTVNRRDTLRILLVMKAALCQACLPPSGEFPAKPIWVDKSTLELSSDEKTLKGKGRILFDQPLFSLYSKELYLLTADFPQADSSLTLHSHFSDFSKQDGIKVFLKRTAENLILHASTPGYPRQEIGVVPDYFLKNPKLSLYIEVANGTENFVDIQIWDFYINPKERLKKPAPFLSQQNQIPLLPDTLFYSRGRGILWGVELNGVRLIQSLRKSVTHP